jgi:hypothetical protein
MWIKHSPWWGRSRARNSLRTALNCLFLRPSNFRASWNWFRRTFRYAMWDVVLLAVYMLGMVGLFLLLLVFG